MTNFKIGSLLSLLILCGCASTASQQQVAGKPTADDIKQMILSQKDRLFKDPSSIRSARIGTTSACIAFGECVCLELNAKNSFGGYTGMSTKTVVYSGGVVTDIREPKDLEFCTITGDFADLNGDFVKPAPSGAPSNRTKSERKT